MDAYNDIGYNNATGCLPLGVMLTKWPAPDNDKVQIKRA